MFFPVARPVHFDVEIDCGNDAGNAAAGGQDFPHESIGVRLWAARNGAEVPDDEPPCALVHSADEQAPAGLMGGADVGEAFVGEFSFDELLERFGRRDRPMTHPANERPIREYVARLQGAGQALDIGIVFRPQIRVHGDPGPAANSRHYVKVGAMARFRPSNQNAPRERGVLPAAGKHEDVQRFHCGRRDGDLLQRPMRPGSERRQRIGSHALDGWIRSTLRSQIGDFFGADSMGAKAPARSMRANNQPQRPGADDRHP